MAGLRHHRRAVPPTFTAIDAAGLGLDRAALLATMDPFVACRLAPTDPRWTAEVARKHAKARRRLRQRRWFGWLGRGKRRDQGHIASEYDQAWARKRLAPYEMDPRPRAGAAWQYGDEVMFATSAAGARARLLVLMRAVALLRPASVLEVGCGNGLNLLVLACRFPATRFAGVELTDGGVATARAVQEETELPAVLRRFAPEPLFDSAAHRRVDFRRGSAAELPFAADAFDLVYSSLALEQMEEIRGRALGEMARVAAHHTLMLEPFWDCNDRGLRRDYLLARDHFRGRIDELPRHGLEPTLVTDDLPGEIWLQPCLVVCRKRPAVSS
ncbi:MAG: class I SAM-dependent methyltransferase [Deltaproteobacteria bacterium]|nr:class I SAM-dependent methyltransferase [Deltaproteobacteria bacterium]